MDIHEDFNGTSFVSQRKKKSISIRIVGEKLVILVEKNSEYLAYYAVLLE